MGKIIFILISLIVSSAFASECDDLNSKLESQIKKIEVVFKERNKVESDVDYLKGVIQKKLDWINQHLNGPDQQKINEYNSLVSDYKRLVGIKKKLNEEYEDLVDEGYDIQDEMKEACKKAH